MCAQHAQVKDERIGSRLHSGAASLLAPSKGHKCSCTAEFGHQASRRRRRKIAQRGPRLRVRTAWRRRHREALAQARASVQRRDGTVSVRGYRRREAVAGHRRAAPALGGRGVRLWREMVSCVAEKKLVRRSGGRAKTGRQRLHAMRQQGGSDGQASYRCSMLDARCSMLSCWRCHSFLRDDTSHPALTLSSTNKSSRRDDLCGVSSWVRGKRGKARC
eukprot:scaffold2862_cov272-Pinguiococcus_pyrenoidosus.AAC.7